MEVEITLKNYRCFSDHQPACFTMRDGLTAFVGVNNSGKSSILRFFYEFRNLFAQLSTPSSNVRNAIQGEPQNLSLAESVLDPDEIFTNLNNRDIEIEIRPQLSKEQEASLTAPAPKGAAVHVSRAGRTWQVRPLPGMTDKERQQVKFAGRILAVAGNSWSDWSPMFEVFRQLSRTLYIGPFRNAINVGTNQSYFDINVGQAFIQAWRTYKTGTIKSQNEAAYRLTDDIKHIFGFDELEINASEDDQTLQIFVDGRSYKLSELGSGLTQFILVLSRVRLSETVVDSR